jgi:cation transport ATPase
VVEGMTCKMCSSAIENHFNKHVEGIKAVSVSLLTNKALIKHDLNIIRPRKIILEIEDLGFGATFQPANEQVDIREITRGEVLKYRNKFILTFLLYLPLAILIWIVPNSAALRPFMTSVQLWNGNTLYILICTICSTII